jgi:hypothetical protein
MAAAVDDVRSQEKMSMGPKMKESSFSLAQVYMAAGDQIKYASPARRAPCTFSGTAGAVYVPDDRVHFPPCRYTILESQSAATTRVATKSENVGGVKIPIFIQKNTAAEGAF